MIIGGLDVGTTGCKITVFTGEGCEIGGYYREYPDRSDPNEADAWLIWTTVQELLTEVAKNHPTLSAFGVTTFGEAFVITEEDGKPLAPVLLCSDARGQKECDELIAKIGKERLCRIAGVAPDTVYSLPKLMWMKNNVPAYKQAKYVFLMEDYIVYMLTGIRQIDYSMAARTMALDIKKKKFSEEILSAARISETLFSEPVPTGTVAGTILPGLNFGFSGDVTVVNGAHDQVAAALGSGVFNEDTAVDGTGTVECVTALRKNPPTDEAYYDYGYCAVPYPSGGYACYAFTLTGGACAKWVRDKLTPDLIRDNPGKSVYRILDSTMPKKPTGLLVLPHFNGSATPYMDSGSRAAIVGIDLTTDRETIYRGVLEGVTYEMKKNLELLDQFGIRPKTLVAAGGGAKSPAWLQMKADIFDCEIETNSVSETGAAGTAMTVAVALGIYPDLKTAGEHFIRPDKKVSPGPQRDEYQKIYGRYRGIYDAVRPLMEGEADNE